MLSICLLGLTGCLQDSCSEEHIFYSYEPIYMSMEELRTQVATESARDLRRPGKLYFYGQYVIINEVNEGFHIFNNEDPRNPRNIAFIHVPGARDMAVKGDVLYADSYLDLVAIDIANPQTAQEVGREQEVFPYGSYHPGLWADESLGIAMDWIETRNEETNDCGNTNWGRNTFWAIDALEVSNFASNSDMAASSVGPSNAPTGIGGSMARFTLVGDYLYAVTNNDMLPFNISDLTNPVSEALISIGWGIETIFPMKDHLFIGSQTGMFVYSLDNPAQPQYLSEFQHVRSCDPVVVEGDYAFVTLRNGAGETACGGFTNELSVVNISNITNPVAEHRYDMTNPHGLGIRDGILFICDGDDGLKVYDASDVSKITSNQLAHFKNINTFDVIPLENILLMIGEDGLYQYDYSDLEDIHEISMIPVVKD